MGRSLEELEMMFAEGKSIPAIVRMSKKPLMGGGLGLQPAREKKSVDEDEFA
jgi:hypothetical protein